MKAILVSGGMDSTIAADMHPDATRIFVDYGQPYAQPEQQTVRQLFGDEVVVVTIRPPPVMQGSYVPARNLLLATVAAQQGAEEVLLCGVADDVYVDNNTEAFADMSRILSLHCGRQVHVHSPHGDRTKGQAAAYYVSQGYDAGRLHRTFSCYNWNGSGRCGACTACTRWDAAMRHAGE